MRENNSPIKREDIKVGDEILISAYSRMRWLRVLSVPSKTRDGVYGRTFKCSRHVEMDTITGTYDDGESWHFDCMHPVLTPENHNKIQRYDLYNRDIWLIKGVDL